MKEIGFMKVNMIIINLMDMFLLQSIQNEYVQLNVEVNIIQ